MKTMATVVVLTALGGIALRLIVVQLEPRAAFFPFRGETTTPRAYGLAFERVSIQTSDGETLMAWWLPAPEGPEILFLHGNGGNLSLWADVIVGIRRQGWSVFALDYRGYGLSTGSPTEQGLYRDADAFLGAFHSRLHTSGRPVIYWGRSLGATVAAYMTARTPPDGLVLEAPLYSARALVAANPVTWLLGWFMSYQFSTSELLSSYSGRTLVVHGDADRVIPLRHGRRVFEELRGDKQMVVVPGADHNDLHLVEPQPYWEAISRFVGNTDE